MAKVKISNSININSNEVAASLTAVKTAYDMAQTAIARFEVAEISNINELLEKQNGWYFIKKASLSGIIDEWIITKFKFTSTDNTKIVTLYTATSTTDPRVFLNSLDLENWYSPYAYWHA